jgi:hypothetical protein
MHTRAVEEGTLLEPANDPEPRPEMQETSPALEPAPAQTEMHEQEVTALVPTELDAIEGEVVEIEPQEETANHALPKQKPYWLCIPFTILCCLMSLGVSLLLPLFTPTATVTLIPVEKTVSITIAILVHGRQVAPLTLMQRASVAATGTRHQNPTRAGGTITFYNGLLSAQTIATGTVLTGSDGTQVVTDQLAIIPPANPPMEGHIAVPAHALLPGVQGNIPAYAINIACCATSVVAKNTAAFTGGAEARDVIVVTRTDMNNAVTSLLVPLSQSENAALQAQLNQGEDVITPSCTPHVASDHQPGDEAKHVSVTVSVTCAGIAYAAHEVDANATQMLTRDAITTLGATYALLGAIQVTIVHGKVLSPRQGVVSVLVQIAGTWVYHITPGRQQQLLHLIAGKPRQQAIAVLLLQPGIQGVQITVKGGNQMLPQNPGEITIRIQYRAV